MLERRHVFSNTSSLAEAAFHYSGHLRWHVNDSTERMATHGITSSDNSNYVLTREKNHDQNLNYLITWSDRSANPECPGKIQHSRIIHVIGVVKSLSSDAVATVLTCNVLGVTWERTHLEIQILCHRIQSAKARSSFGIAWSWSRELSETRRLEATESWFLECRREPIWLIAIVSVTSESSSTDVERYVNIQNDSTLTSSPSRSQSQSECLLVTTIFRFRSILTNKINLLPPPQAHVHSRFILAKSLGTVSFSHNAALAAAKVRRVKG